MNNINKDDSVPSPFYPDENSIEILKAAKPSVSEEQFNKITDFIEKETGMKGMILVLVKEAIPCAEKLAGKPCEGHVTELYKKNLSDDYAIETLKQIAEAAETLGKKF